MLTVNVNESQELGLVLSGRPPESLPLRISHGLEMGASMQTGVCEHPSPRTRLASVASLHNPPRLGECTGSPFASRTPITNDIFQRVPEWFSVFRVHCKTPCGLVVFLGPSQIVLFSPWGWRLTCVIYSAHYD